MIPDIVTHAVVRHPTNGKLITITVRGSRQFCIEEIQAAVNKAVSLQGSVVFTQAMLCLDELLSLGCELCFVTEKERAATTAYETAVKTAYKQLDSQRAHA